VIPVSFAIAFARKLTMAYVVSLLIGLFATSEATLLHCSSTYGSGSMAHLQQATTLQYCVADNCTIMMI